MTNMEYTIKLVFPPRSIMANATLPGFTKELSEAYISELTSKNLVHYDESLEIVSEIHRIIMQQDETSTCKGNVFHEATYDEVSLALSTSMIHGSLLVALNNDRPVGLSILVCSAPKLYRVDGLCAFIRSHKIGQNLLNVGKQIVNTHSRYAFTLAPNIQSTTQAGTFDPNFDEAELMQGELIEIPPLHTPQIGELSNGISRVYLVDASDIQGYYQSQGFTPCTIPVAGNDGYNLKIGNSMLHAHVFDWDRQIIRNTFRV
uniref:Uncharacterized protein n=1 Tax=viral metagenome TaxID=1070528 RepID=A0A6C0K999_9ZZZZ